MKKLLMIVGMMLAAALVTVWAAETEPAESGKNPPDQVAWGQPSNGVQEGLSAKTCRFTCPTDKPGFTG